MSDFNPVTVILSIAMVSMIPFTVIASTSFIKISIVLYIVRNAIGVQQVPPNIVLHSIALFLSLYVMSPVISQVTNIMDSMQSKKEVKITEIVDKVAPPLKRFLLANTEHKVLNQFHNMSEQLWPEDWKKEYHKDSLLILLPAFAIQELSDAFRIGFLIYLPFIVIDMIVSNVLLALGMMMMSPLTISLPIKILLFISIDGWTKTANGLVMSYKI